MSGIFNLNPQIQTQQQYNLIPDLVTTTQVSVGTATTQLIGSTTSLSPRLLNFYNSGTISAELYVGGNSQKFLDMPAGFAIVSIQDSGRKTWSAKTTSGSTNFQVTTEGLILY